MRPPRVRTRSFPSSVRRIYTSGPCSYWASSCPADLPTLECLMRFLFVGPTVCRGLPSDSASRRTPLPLAMRLALPPALGTFTLENVPMPSTPVRRKRDPSGSRFLFPCLSSGRTLRRARQVAPTWGFLDLIHHALQIPAHPERPHVIIEFGRAPFFRAAPRTLRRRADAGSVRVRGRRPGSTGFALPAQRFVSAALYAPSRRFDRGRGPAAPLGLRLVTSVPPLRGRRPSDLKE